MLECSSTYLALYAINELFNIVILMDLWKLWIICFHCIYFIQWMSALVHNPPFFHLLLSLYSHTLCFFFVLCTLLYVMPFLFLCFVSGAKGLQSPPQSLFLSFPTSLYRPREPRHFCSKWFFRAGPTAWSMEPQWYSAKVCSMRCTKLEVNNSLL